MRVSSRDERLARNLDTYAKKFGLLPYDKYSCDGEIIQEILAEYVNSIRCSKIVDESLRNKFIKMISDHAYGIYKLILDMESGQLIVYKRGILGTRFTVTGKIVYIRGIPAATLVSEDLSEVHVPFTIIFDERSKFDHESINGEVRKRNYLDGEK